LHYCEACKNTKKSPFLATIFRYIHEKDSVPLFVVCSGVWDKQGKNRESLIREGLNQLGIVSNQFTYCTEETGKPFVSTEVGRVEISVSHHKETMVVVVSAGARVGIDIEPKYRNVSKNLQKRIVVGEVEAQIPTLQLWTLKEAFLKMTGTGLRMAMQKVQVVPVRLHQFKAQSSDKLHTANLISFTWRDYQITVALSSEK